jgi:hypothetical protein
VNRYGRKPVTLVFFFFFFTRHEQLVAVFLNTSSVRSD